MDSLMSAHVIVLDEIFPILENEANIFRLNPSTKGADTHLIFG